MIGLPLAAPVEPDADEAYEWLVEELSKPQYQAAQPTLFDRLAQAFWDWLTSLEIGGVQGPPALGLLLVIIVVAALIVVAFLVFGVPRLRRRSRLAGALFGEDDERDAAALRRDARAAASAGDFALAIAEMYRCIARGLSERGVLTTTPGTTASSFARRAGELFPAQSAALQAASRVFDDVRYLGGAGSMEQFESVAALESRLRSARATTETVPA